MLGAQTYAEYWRYCFTYAKHWHPDITVPEVNCFCRSTWDGVNGDDQKARLYFHVSLEESGLHQMDNKAGFGWSGATWPVIHKALHWHGPGIWLWAEQHPYQVNKAVAFYFASKVDEKTVGWWHSPDDLKKNMLYTKKVMWIAKYCKGDSNDSSNY